MTNQSRERRVRYNGDMHDALRIQDPDESIIFMVGERRSFSRTCISLVRCFGRGNSRAIAMLSDQHFPALFVQIQGMSGIRKMAKQNYCLRRKDSVALGMGRSLRAGKRSGVLSGNDYEILLNFRGKDTRQGFTNCFYHVLRDGNIHVFFDEIEIPVGKKIEDELQIAIKKSKIYVPIFSKGYASSLWCLGELAHMVKCKKSKPSEKEILLIFYDVKPRDVKLECQLYVGVMVKHEEKFGQQTTREWKDALGFVAQIKGWVLKKEGHVGFLNHSINFCFNLDKISFRSFEIE